MGEAGRQTPGISLQRKIELDHHISLFLHSKPHFDGISPLSIAAVQEWEDYLGRWETKLAPLLFERLQQRGRLNEVPQEIRDRLRAAYLRNACRNTVFLHTFRELCELLRSRDVDCILFKGAAVGLRNRRLPFSVWPLSDMDLLIPRERFIQVRAALRAEGFTEVYYRQLGNSYKAAYRAANQVAVFDIHSDIYWTWGSYLIEYSDLIDRRYRDRAGEESFDELSVRTLGIEDEICVRFFHDALSNPNANLLLNSIARRYLFAEFLSGVGTTVDWPRLRELLKASGYDRLFFAYLAHLQAEMGLSLQPSAQESVARALQDGRWVSTLVSMPERLRGAQLTCQLALKSPNVSLRKFIKRFNQLVIRHNVVMPLRMANLTKNGFISSTVNLSKVVAVQFAALGYCLYVRLSQVPDHLLKGTTQCQIQTDH